MVDDAAPLVLGSDNPSAGMGVSYKVKNGNRPTSRSEYERYCAAAIDLGYPSMAAAAALEFELIQRVWDLFGIPDPDLNGVEPEARLAAVRPSANPTDPIVIDERTGKPYMHRRINTVHRRICDAGGLPKAMTFTGFRHGGATEVGDAGETDLRSLSGHSKLDTTAIYNKASEEKARRIAVRRREHLAQIAAADAAGDDE